MSLEWCAGFFDGEGSVGCWHNRPRPRSGSKRLAASIGQNSREPLDCFVKYTGIGKVRGPYRSTNGDGEHYQWSAFNSDVVALYKLIGPYLRFKYAQFDKALSDYSEYKASVKIGRPKSRGLSK